MNLEKLRRRRLKILKALAEKAKGRNDVFFPLSELEPTLDFKGSKFIDKEKSDDEENSDLAYDYTSLYKEGLITRICINEKKDGGGALYGGETAIQIADTGITIVAEENKFWLTKAIDKQPMTFLQIILTIILALITGFGGWIIGRYFTPLNENTTTSTMPAVQSNSSNQ